jgi:hypothetical protein
MSRNPSGVYSLPAGSTITNGDTSDATDVNTPLADLEADANVARPIVAGGTGATSVSAAQTAFKIAPYDGAATITGTWDMSGGTITLPDGNIATAKIADDAVTLAKIADAALSGADATVITGTAGTENFTAKWNADGDLVDGYEVLDEDDFASDSATALVTQQSAKAYVASQFAANPSPIKAWVNFTVSGGTATVADGLNVSSVTRNGTGDFTVNFTSNLANATYALSGSADRPGFDRPLNVGPSGNVATPFTVSSARFVTTNDGGTNTDPGLCTVIIVGSDS